MDAQTVLRRSLTSSSNDDDRLIFKSICGAPLVLDDRWWVIDLLDDDRLRSITLDDTMTGVVVC